MNKLNRPIHLPDAERGRSDADLGRWSKAHAELSSDRLALNEKQKDARLRTMAHIEAAPGIEVDKAWRAQAMEETVILAELRGEDVERSRTGSVRVNSRDPLASLLRGGHLTADQCWIGVSVRELYERRFAGAGSQLGALGAPGGVHDNDRFVFFQLGAAQALQRVCSIERAITSGGWCTADGSLRQVANWRDIFAVQSPNVALSMLRAVCGAGHSLSSQGEGRAFERNANCLAAALDVASEVLRGRA